MEWKFDTIKDKVRELAEKYMDDFEVENDKFEAILPEIPAIVERVTAKLEDGFQFSDLIVLGEIVPDVMRIVDKFPNLTNAEKHELVVDALWVIYKTIDKYPGDANNINIPILFGGFEEKAEYFMIKVAIGTAIKAAYQYFADEPEADNKE